MNHDVNTLMADEGHLTICLFYRLSKFIFQTVNKNATDQRVSRNALPTLLSTCISIQES